MINLNFRIRNLLLFLIFITASIFFYLECSEDQRVIFIPTFLVLLTLLGSIYYVWALDARYPFIDVGISAIVISSVYILYPSITLLIAGLKLTELSDARLYSYNPTPSELARVIWWGGIYIFSLSSAYLIVRKKISTDHTFQIESLERKQLYPLVSLSVLIIIFYQLVQLAFDVNLDPTYGSLEAGWGSLPLVLHQIIGKSIGIKSVFELALILILIINLKDWRCKGILIFWASWVLLSTLITFGARSKAAFFFLAIFLAYQRSQKAVSPLKSIIMGFIFLSLILSYGFLRDGMVFNDEILYALTATNEFQASFTNAFDLIYRREEGTLPDISTTLYFADILRAIPQQLLPFEKMDQSQWYLNLLGVGPGEGGYVFGVIPEAAIGLGLFELALRGVVLGAVLGFVHNWYYKNASKFWPTLFYIWLITIIYYTYRAGTFYIIIFVLTYFIPAVLMVKITSLFFDRQKINFGKKK